MDIKNMLPLFMDKLGDREKALISATQERDPAALSALLTQLQQQKTPRIDVYAVFKRIIPAETLGAIIKYFDSAPTSGK